MKKFTMTVVENSSAELMIETTNEGFTAMEVIGLLEAKKMDVIAQIDPDAKFKRYKLNDDGSKTEIVSEKEETNV